ncbi:phosphotransferase [Neobacillus dielmonensis]|uniref:phosphotransferase n=1 Tax=Neobacillus dielmonensis TaxID=1347369 RepID=UPI000694ECF9|nr:phosphotransferase [Neobacillus dielmonensis]
MNKVTQAVILAAGEISAFHQPVGFLELEDTTVIERMITTLNANGINNITIITGYKKQYYEELAKHPDVKIVYSSRYKWTGTMHSLVTASDYINGDFLLIEGDLVFEERAITHILNHPNRNCMMLTSESGSGDEVLVEIRDNYIQRISKDVHQLNKIDGEFIGISKISIEAYREMIEEFKFNRNPYFNYEYALLSIIHKHNIGYVKLDDLVWSEIDSIKHYDTLKYVIFPKLKRKETEVRTRYVRDLLSEILELKPNLISHVEKLGGLTNNNYKVNINGRDCVARLPGVGTEKFIDRTNEKANAAIAYKLGLDSKALYFNEVTGLKVVECIPNAETLNAATARHEENMELMAEALRTLHHSNETFHHDFDPFEEIQQYEKLLYEANGNPFNDYHQLKQQFMPLKNELEHLGMKRVPCHLDTLPENFIKSGDEKLYLIDWEYSGNYDPLWDVAAVSLECGFSEDEEELFFSKYFGESPGELESQKLTIHKIIQDMYWYIWSAAKMALGDPYLAEFSLHKYTSGKNNLENYLASRTASLVYK